MASNLCRCTGYQGIVDAVLATAEQRRRSADGLIGQADPPQGGRRGCLQGPRPVRRRLRRARPGLGAASSARRSRTACSGGSIRRGARRPGRRRRCHRRPTCPPGWRSRCGWRSRVIDLSALPAAGAGRRRGALRGRAGRGGGGRGPLRRRGRAPSWWTSTSRGPPVLDAAARRPGRDALGAATSLPTSRWATATSSGVRASAAHVVRASSRSAGTRARAAGAPRPSSADFDTGAAAGCRSTAPTKVPVFNRDVLAGLLGMDRRPDPRARHRRGRRVRRARRVLPGGLPGAVAGPTASAARSSGPRTAPSTWSRSTTPASSCTVAGWRSTPAAASSRCATT